LQAVRLDDEAARAPEEVDLVVVDDDVDLRTLDALVVAEVEHERLELEARERRLVVDASDDLGEGGRARARSSNVRLTDVTGMALCLSTSGRPSVSERCTTMPRRRSRPPPPGTVT
jgi:hypothetical protein